MMNLPFTVHIEPQTAFPMVKLHNLAFSVMWLPMTKIQVEYFLSETSDSRFDDKWYQTCLSKNSRHSIYTITSSNFWRSFMTGITFKEVKVLRQWWSEFDIPTKEEWTRMSESLGTIPAQSEYIQAVCHQIGVNARAKLLIEQLENLHQSQMNRTVAHQMCLQNGIEEYVYRDSNRQSCDIVGNPPRHLSGGRKTELRDSQEGIATESLGFRLIKRA